jgi:hypothetical protein
MEVKMSEEQEYMDPQWWNFMVIDWHENQTAITFQSKLDLSHGSQEIIESLHLEDLNQFLNMRGFNLKSFTPDDVPSSSQSQQHSLPDEKEGPIETLVEDGFKALVERIKTLEEMILGRPEKDDDEQRENGEIPINNPLGKYLFPSPSAQGTTVVGFFHVETSKMAYSTSSMGSMGGNGNQDSYGEQDNTRQLVNLINRNLDTLRQGKIPVVAATPNWLSSGAGCITHTEGVSPIPINPGNSCTSSPGLWPIRIPALSSETSPIREMTGEDVTVFVLDSMPPSEEITNAAASVGNNNLLLQEIVQQISGSPAPSINLKWQTLGKRLDDSTSSEQPKSGNDLYGRPFTPYPSSDHGLFITGILRDLAQGATIEYIRVLNDFGVGDTSGLLDALGDIRRRMGKDGDLYKQPVVINLSLGAIPSREDLARLWFNAECSCQQEEFVHTLEDIELLQLGLHLVIQSLTELGAVIVASAGNDSSIHQWEPGTANPTHRQGPRYPAAFPEVISVGAVDRLGRAAAYSNYPQLPPNHNGIATYGGGIPRAVAPVGPLGHVPPGDRGPDPHIMTTAIDVDGVIGVYTAPQYPALSADDQPQVYDAPDRSYDWAYWSGTSFAAPIISAVVARILQLKSSSWLPYQRAAEVQRAITSPTGQSELLTGGSPLPLQTDFGFGVRMLRAYQCEEAQQASVAGETVSVEQKV